MRTIVLHYHLFKNAGSSVDEILKATFPGRFTAREFDPPRSSIYPQVLKWIEQEPQAIYFSSHTAVLPPPKLAGIKVIPIIMLRHPIDRIASVYGYERIQDSDDYGPTMARELPFRDYIYKRLEIDWQLKNFQVAFLSRMFPEQDRFGLDLAITALDQLPFYGIVEDFSNSLRRLSQLLQGCGLAPLVTFEAFENVNRDISLPLQKRLDQIRSDLGSEHYNYLIESNRDDLELYQYALDHLKSPNAEK